MRFDPNLFFDIRDAPGNDSGDQQKQGHEEQELGVTASNSAVVRDSDVDTLEGVNEIIVPFLCLWKTDSRNHAEPKHEH